MLEPITGSGMSLLLESISSLGGKKYRSFCSETVTWTECVVGSGKWPRVCNCKKTLLPPPYLGEPKGEGQCNTTLLSKTWPLCHWVKTIEEISVPFTLLEYIVPWRFPLPEAEHSLFPTYWLSLAILTQHDSLRNAIYRLPAGAYERMTVGLDV